MTTVSSTMGSSNTGHTLDVETVRADFPILSRRLADDRALVYLDSANTSQKPRQVIAAMSEHYERSNANVARAVHQLGAESTEAFEGARGGVARFIGAGRPEEVVFTRNATEALNLVARVLGEPGDHAVTRGDEVVVTEMEHHSNLVPWQQLCQRVRADLRWFELTDDGHLDMSQAAELINEHTRVVSLTLVSNMLGTVNPVTEIARRAHDVGALVVVDASQAVPHRPIDVASLGADFVAFTGHKMCGPTGIGVLWGRHDLLSQLPPFLGGGEMIETVTMAGSTYAPPPHRFEAGTPPITEAVGLGAAVAYLEGIGMDAVADHERSVTAYLLDALSSVAGLRVVGPGADDSDRGGAVSFTLDGVHPHDVSQLLDARGIAVRAGHHCAKPAHQRFGVQSTTRVSSYLYTTTGEVDVLVEGLDHVRRFFA